MPAFRHIILAFGFERKMTLWQRLKTPFERILPHARADEPLAEAQLDDEAPAPPALFLTGHIGGIGDQQANGDGWVGRASGLPCIEAFLLASERPEWRNDITIQPVLHGGALGPPVPGGTFCGIRGRGVPLHGYLVQVADGAFDLAGLTCEGVFQDGFRSGRLPAGTACVSPSLAALVAMRIALGPVPDTGPEGAMPQGRHWLPPPPMAEQAADNEPANAQPDDAVADSIDPAPEGVSTSLVGHIANIGDTEADAQGWVGVTEHLGRIEGFAFDSAEPGWQSEVRYRAVLETGELGPEIAGGEYCGTQGEALPIYGFAVYVTDGATALDGLFYEGVFEGGFRSKRLRPGDICVSPTLAPLTALRIGIAAPPPEKTDSAEPVRAVIWDLDETFWGGTLTEGGISWREENADIVRTLARRGIISSICSKNDDASVAAVLEEHGMRDYFVFPSITWDPKGPRLKTLVETLQLRAPTLLFIDDNPMNRAEAESFVPGLQVRDETCVPELLGHKLLQGKPDPDMQRLAQYRLLERRRADQVQSGGDTDDFLRVSGITVTIEHDLAPHLDRAIELINRTNQLNFTKNRLAEDPGEARRELRALLAEYDVQAGILRVHDRYGDYGYCGLYVSQRYSVGAPFLVHFAFSCRILGMGIETWLYRRLSRPRLDVVGPVLTNVFDETREIDWIGVELPGIAQVPAEARHDLNYVLARGACDMRALSHYFSMIAGRVIEEFDTVRAGQSPLINHSLIATQAMKGFDPRAIEDFLPLGFLPEDFNTILAGDAPAGPAVWLLGFTIEQPATVYRHKATGTLLPFNVTDLNISAAAMMRGDAAEGADPAVIAHLRDKFDFFGERPDNRLDRLLQDSLRQIFSRAGRDVRVFVMLANTFRLDADGNEEIDEVFRHHNGVVAEIAAAFANVQTLSPESFMTRAELRALRTPHHFDRIVYFRIFQYISQTINKQQK